MPLIIGSRDGVYRLPTVDSSDVECVLAEVEVYDLAGRIDELYVAAVDGLYCSTDGCETWTNLDLPVETVTSLAASPDDSRVYAGTMPAHVYVSEDAETWTELPGFRDLPTRDDWYNRDVPVHVRSLGVHPNVASRVVAGVDGGGVHVSDDFGETWQERLTCVPQYVHEVLVCDEEEYVAVTDAGLFRTTNGGRWWDFLHDDDLKHRYFRGAVRDGRTVYAGGARSHPPTWWREGGADAALYEIDFSENARRPRMSPVPYPGEPDELVLGGVERDGQIVMGTTEGRLLLLDDDAGWETLARLPVRSEIRALYAV